MVRRTDRSAKPVHNQASDDIIGIKPGRCDDKAPDCVPQGVCWSQNLTEDLSDVKKSEAEEKALGKRLEGTNALIKTRQLIHASRLVVTALPLHSDVERCDDVYSLGPDMVSMVENMFCDMSEKRLWPVCAGNTTSYCFNMGSQTVKASDIYHHTWANTSTTFGEAVSLAAGNSHAPVPAKSYTTVDSCDI
jgi:hypothetical protein